MGKLTRLQPNRVAAFDGRRVKPVATAKQVDPFYLSPEWRQLVAEIKRERWPRLMATQGHCCEDPECRAQHTSQTRIFFDHVLERRDRPDLELVKSNIMGRCGSSHTTKTLRERARRLSGGGGVSNP